MMKVTSAPGNLIVATSDGVNVRFAGIELTGDISSYPKAPFDERGIKVNLEVVRDQETVKRDQIYNEALFQWFQRKNAQGSDSAGPLPIMPGVLAFEPVELEISDDVGTEYRIVAGQVGGTGTEWTAFWTYLPEPPRQARILTLAFTLHGTTTGRTCQIQLDQS